MGYTPDFVHSALVPHLSEIKKRNIRIISNAGGINPHSCATAVKAAAKKVGLDFKIAVVTGDDLLPQVKRNLIYFLYFTCIDFLYFVHCKK